MQDTRSPEAEAQFIGGQEGSDLLDIFKYGARKQRYDEWQHAFKYHLKDSRATRKLEYKHLRTSIIK